MDTKELKPCPWCGKVPDVSNDAYFQLTSGCKWGTLVCCGAGPDVRTDYKDVPHWKQSAIDAWNDRAELEAVAGAPDLRSAILQAREAISGDPRDQAHAAGWNACRESMQAALASAAPVEAEPLATIILGGIEGDEYGDIDMEVISMKALEEIQTKLVRTDEPVLIHLYADARAIEARIMGGAK